MKILKPLQRDTIIKTTFILYGYETYSLPLWGQQRLMVFQNRELRRYKYLGLTGRKWQEAGEDCILRSFII
jgi:hypothetical protein